MHNISKWTVKNNNHHLKNSQKYKMNKLTNQQQQQPICMVCGETSSTGYHCGAVTCEACKVRIKLWK